MGWFATSLATRFLNCDDHLPFICNLTCFYGCECYQTNYINCNGCKSPYVKPYTYATHVT